MYGYYEARAERGDQYAVTALQVVQNTGFLGMAANVGLSSTAAINGVEYDEYDVNVMLMEAHGAAVNSDNNGVPGLLSAEQITIYHHEIFSSMGLPTSTFGGTPVTGTLIESSVWESIWCGGCDSR